jgi:hypothetical protein
VSGSLARGPFLVAGLSGGSVTGDEYRIRKVLEKQVEKSMIFSIGLACDSLLRHSKTPF